MCTASLTFVHRGVGKVESLAIEVKPLGIDVLVVEPGPPQDSATDYEDCGNPAFPNILHKANLWTLPENAVA